MKKNPLTFSFLFPRKGKVFLASRKMQAEQKAEVTCRISRSGCCCLKPKPVGELGGPQRR